MALSEDLEREPTAHELAAALGVADSELDAFRAHAQPRQMISFDEVSENQYGEDNISLAERLADPGAVLPDARVRTWEDRRLLAQCVSRLPKTQATVLVLHYLQNVPLREVAQLLAVTPSRVSQLHRRGLDRLRQMWTSALNTP